MTVGTAEKQQGTARSIGAGSDRIKTSVERSGSARGAWGGGGGGQAARGALTAVRCRGLQSRAATVPVWDCPGTARCRRPATGSDIEQNSNEKKPGGKQEGGKLGLTQTGGVDKTAYF